MANVTQRLLFRYLQLSRRAKKGEKPEPAKVDEAFPALHVLANDVWARFSTVGERHVPALENGKPKTGQRYIVPLRRQVHAKSGAVTLRICVYTGGESPGFAPRDLDAAEASISYQQVVDEDGEVLAPGAEFSVLMLGRVLLIQNRQGVGAAKAVQRIVHWFGRQICGKSFVMPQFMSVAPKSVAKQIEEAGGVVAVSFGIAEMTQDSGGHVALQDIHKFEERLGGDKTRIRISAAGDETLDSEASLHMLEDHDEEGLSNVRLHLKNSETITGDQMVLSKPAHVPLANGVPDCDSVDKELLAYLQELMRVDSGGEQSVNADGLIGSKLKIVKVKAKT